MYWKQHPRGESGHFRWVALAGILALGCAAAAPPPDWVETAGRTRRYPDASYVTGFAIAQGDDALDSARQRAAADLAARLEVRIEHELRDVSEERDGTYRYHVAALTRSTVDLQLSGIEYETWSDGETVYALALLDRGAAARQRRAQRDLSLAEVRACLSAGSRLEVEGRRSAAIAAFEDCRRPIAEALEHAAVAGALNGLGVEDSAVHVELTNATRTVDERVEAILRKPVASLSGAAESLALQLQRQGVSTGDTLVVSPFTYGTADLSSAFGRQLALDLEVALAQHARPRAGSAGSQSGAQREIVLHGVYVEAEDAVRLDVTAKQASTARLVASAGTTLARSAIPASLELLPSNFLEALEAQRVLSDGGVITGDLRLDLWTSRGRKGVVFAEGDEYRIFLRANRPVWVRLVYVLTSGEQVPIDWGYRIDAPLVGSVVEYPERFAVVPPFGVEHVYATAFTARPPELPTRRQVIGGIPYEVLADDLEEIARRRGDRLRSNAEIAEAFVAITTMPRTPRVEH